MNIEVIEDFRDFIEIRDNWNSVYENDPQAHFFLSWEWLSGWLEMIHESWFILSAKTDDDDETYVAFFPLKMSLGEQREAGFYTELCMAGNSMADYTGLLCLPGYEEEVIPAFVSYIQHKLVWSTFNLQSILQEDARMRQILERFSGDTFEFRQHRVFNKGEETDNYIAPYVVLDDDWDSYLQGHVSSNTRQKIRRFLRKVDSSDEFHITYVNESNLESHIEILLTFWKITWGEQKGSDLDIIVDYVRAILRHCFEQDCLYFSVLWQGDTPLGAIASFVDIRQKSILFFISSRDETFKGPPPGLILHADAIRYAIQHGFKVYDFLKGNETYKYSFGVNERHIKHIIARYKDWQNKKLDTRVLPLALEQTIQYHRTNQLARAEQGYQKILDAQPDYGDALYGLGALMKQKGEYQFAEGLIKRLIALQPNSFKAWFSLGHLYQSQDNLSEAIAAYRQSIALQPNSPAVYNNLGYALQQQGNWEEAIACYQSAMELQPDCVEAEVNWANALYSQGQLLPEKYIHYAEMNYSLGSRCSQMGDVKTATAYYQHAASMQPDVPNIHYQLGRMLQQQADYERAIACYRKTLELKPDFEDAQVQLNQLEHL